MHVHHVGAAVEVHIPDLLGDQGSGEHFALPARQQRQQQKLLGGQVQALAVPRGQEQNRGLPSSMSPLRR